MWAAHTLRDADSVRCLPSPVRRPLRWKKNGRRACPCGRRSHPGDQGPSRQGAERRRGVQRRSGRRPRRFAAAAAAEKSGKGMSDAQDRSAAPADPIAALAARESAGPPSMRSAWRRRGCSTAQPATEPSLPPVTPNAGCRSCAVYTPRGGTAASGLQMRGCRECCAATGARPARAAGGGGGGGGA